ncbi:unnamed protein product [Chironomus riparius]|uniref:Uncharacterized protein n=1 Tax=Chironomus riparius TaxID=315576 RepID=A0A9N9RFV1_9DIPT|nr:unnamed protein product [Chironomus riparius]
MKTLVFIVWFIFVTGCVCLGRDTENYNLIRKVARKAKRCYPISNFSTSSIKYTTNGLSSTQTTYSNISSTTTGSTQAPTTPSAASWPSNQVLREQISQAILKFGGNLSVSEYQGLMDTSRDLNTFMQYWNSTQMLILTPIIGQIIVSQAAIHNSSSPIASITYDADAQQNITLALQEYAPNMTPDDIQFVITTLQTMSTIAVNSLTLDELTQMAQACANAFINNTLVNGPIETTTVSSTTTSSTQAPTTPSAASWPSNQVLREQISQAILKFGGNLSVSEYQGLMDTSRDLNNFMQYWNSTQMLILTPIIGQIIVSQAAIHNSSSPITSITYDADAQQNITLALQEYAPNMTPDDIQFVITTLQTMSTIAVNSLTLDELTQMAQACANAFINNTLVNGPIETTTVSSTTTSSTQAPTTPSAASWPSNQVLREQISQAILKFGGNLSVSEYQGLMDTSRDLNTFMQYWNSTQMLILTPIIGQIIVSQAAIHNSSSPITSITYDADAQQNITLALQEYAPNMTPDDIQFVITTLQTMSTIAVNSLTLDELTQMAQACANAFINNTLVNGPIETTNVSSTTTSSTQAPTTPSAASWPSNQVLREQISQAILKFGGNLSVSEYQGLMDTSRDLNNFMQYWNSTQMLILTPIIGQIIVSQAEIHNSSSPITSIKYDADAQQNITLALREYAPNMTPDDIQFVITTLQTMSTIAVNSLTLDELTQMAQACANAFINNTLVNGPIETTTVSSTTTSSTQAPTTPSAASWPSNQVLREQISQAILKFGGNLSVSEYQGLMDTSRDLNTFMQYWNSTQMLILTPIIGQIIVSQAAIHNSSSPITSITYDADAQQNITLALQEYAPNMTPDDIQFVITTLQTMSTIAVNSLTLDELTQMAQACANAFINNTLVNGPIETTTVSSTTTSSTQAPTTPSAASWPSNQVLREQISQAILKFGGNLSVSEYQGLMDTSRDLNTFMQYWNSTQMLILTPIIGQIIVSQAAIHNSSSPITSITYDADAQQNITLALQEYAPNMTPDDIQFVITTLQTMSTIAVNSLTLDELTQMAQACANAFINNTLVNGPIETTTVSTSSTTSTTVPIVTTSTLSPAINQQLTNSISSLAPGLNQTQIQNLLHAIQVLANTYYFTPAQTIVVAPGLSLFFMYHSGSSVAINGTTAVYTDADVLSIVTFFNTWVPAMTSEEIQNYITNMKLLSYYSQGVTPLEALSLAPALSQIFINQASAQTAAP